MINDAKSKLCLLNLPNSLLAKMIVRQFVREKTEKTIPTTVGLIFISSATLG
jgi:hypothetical protein